MQITLTVWDEDGGSRSTNQTIAADNVAPTMTADASSRSVKEGSTATNSGTFLDPGDDTVTLTASVGTVEDNGDGTWNWSWNTSDGPDDSQVIAITATDSDGAETQATFDLTVDNVAPEINNLELQSWDTFVSMSVDFSDVGSLDTHALLVDWGDGGQSMEAVSPGINTLTHEYDTGGIFDVTVTVSDDDGGEAVSSAIAFATGIRVNEGVLEMVGTPEADRILISKIGRRHYVTANFLPGWFRTESFVHDDYDQIQVYVGAGNDLAIATGNVRHNMFVDGGAGDDRLVSARGDDVLLGGNGDDLLLGRRGRDLLIGGRGSDRILGTAGSDLLISGYTAFDAQSSALLALAAEWSSDRDDAARRENLLGANQDAAQFAARLNESFFLISSGETQTVFDDGDQDRLIGGGGWDWYFASLGGEDEEEDDLLGLDDEELVEWFTS